jgi:predicted TPR repeat methyltransferase
MNPSVGPEFFNDIYARNIDPWGFETSEYERLKYADTLAQLPPGRFRSGLEIGCSTGVLSGILADRCDRLLGVDFAEAALAEARRRHAGRSDLVFSRMHLPGEKPAGHFDLIVLSEILYFMDRADVQATARVVGQLGELGATVILAHWLGNSADHPLHADEAVEAFIVAASNFASPVKNVRREGYRLDLLQIASEGDDEPFRVR